MTRGIPTTYRGARFRSRLEARWAAMFDLLGWKWTYEPFDAEGYIPDFVIQGPEPFLVEIKPATLLAELAEHRNRVERAVQRTWKHPVVFLGASPSIDGGAVNCAGLMSVWWGLRDMAWVQTEARWGVCWKCGKIGLSQEPGCSMQARPCGCDELRPAMIRDELWNRAGSSVQWRQQPW